MSVHQHLMTGEMIVSEHPPFYLTSLRIVRYEEGPEGVGTHALPLERLIGVNEVKSTHHYMMIIGSVLLIGGLVLAVTWGLITSFLAIASGVAALVMGAKGKTTGYQIMAHNVPKEDQSLWQLPSWGALKFVETLRSRVGRQPGFP
jgi:hypothetical protein